MRIIIFGDLHANWEALLSLQQAERNPEAVLCLGDTVGYGPDPAQCLEAIRSRATHLIQGRHDRAVGGPAPDSGNPLLESSWAYTRSILSETDRAYLAGLPTELSVEIEGVRFHLTRFPPDDSDTENQMLITMRQSHLEELFGHIEADFILVGGPHIPAMRQVGGKLIVCPGSLGLPYYGVADPTFAAWQDGQMKMHHLHYHPDATIRKLSNLPLSPAHIVHLQSILETGRAG